MRIGKESVIIKKLAPVRYSTLNVVLSLKSALILGLTFTFIKSKTTNFLRKIMKYKTRHTAPILV
jgi:hypothetical protein